MKVNDRIAEMTGYSCDELMGKNARILYPSDTDFEFVGIKKYDLIRKKGTGTVETRWIRKDGTIRDILLSSTPLDPSDSNRAVMFTALDITDRKNAESELHTAYEQLANTEEELRKQYLELARAKESLKEANHKLHLLSSITRHDILNKITVLRGNIELIKSRSANPAIAGFLKKVDSSAVAIRDLIEFTRVYQDLGSLEPRWHRLDSVISSLEIPPHISLRQTLDHTEIYADPILEKVFYNFLDNSVMHGKKVTMITVSSCEVKEGLLISWEDNGVGIPADEKEKIFTQFFGKHTGLGLFLAHEICSVTGIILRETGEPGKGARFEMLVPKTGYRFTSNSGKKR
jgi:PAS domain S-box-containing protein